MVEKDIYCTKCGHESVNVDVGSCEWSGDDRPCGKCKADTPHAVLCNGGCGAFTWKGPNSWNEENSKGHVEYLGTEAFTMDEDGRKQPYYEADGSRVDHQSRFSTDAIKEREQRNETIRKQKRGTSPLFFLPRG